MLIRVLILLILPGLVFSQSRLDIEEHINKIISQGDDTNNSRYYDLLVYYLENPIDLNKANANELMLLDLLSKEQVDQILNHRVATGSFDNIYELQAIESLSTADIRLIMPFIIIVEDYNLLESFKAIGGSGNSYLASSYSRLLEQARGFSEGVYLGSPDKAQFRLRLRNPGKLSIGLAAQKDPGEPWLHDTQVKQPDYLTGHIYLEKHGRVKQLAVGDYRMQFGQGLLLGAGFMAGKNVETVTSVKQSTLGVLPYSSVAEDKFFRGAGLNIEIVRGLDVAMFYSYKYLDATISSDDPTIVSSIRSGGFHRTSSEINSRNSLQEKAWGAAINYSGSALSMGVLMLSNRFDKNIIPADQLYNHHKFSGNHVTNLSWFGEYRFNSFTWFGEIAKSIDAGWGINSGLIGQVSRYAGLSLSLRLLEKDFYSFYGQSFTERSSLGNENGIYWGIKLYPGRKVTISSYYDIYSFPWLISSTSAPAHGRDMMARVEYQFSKTNKAFVQARSEIVETSINHTPIDQIAENKILKTIINFDYSSSANLSFRSRVQYNIFNKNEAGFLALQDINYSNLMFGLSGRVLLFDTDSYATRQYVYEKDMLYSFTTRAFYGRGISYYLLIKYKPLRALSMRGKISYTEYIGVSEIGSGNNLIEGNTRTQISFQLHYKF